LGPDPEIGGDTLGPDPGILVAAASGRSQNLQPAEALASTREPEAGMPNRLARARGYAPTEASVGTAGIWDDALAGDSLTALISWAMDGHVLGSLPAIHAFLPDMDRLFRLERHDVLRRGCAAQRASLYTVDGHEPSCGRAGGRDSLDDGRAAGAGRPQAPAAWGVLGPETTAPASTVMTLLQVLQRMRRIRLSDLLIRYRVAGLTAIADELHGSLGAPRP